MGCIIDAEQEKSIEENVSKIVGWFPIGYRVGKMKFIIPPDHLLFKINR